MTHIMLDIETWGKKPGCDIRSIGACVFDPLIGYVAEAYNGGDQFSDCFYVATDNPCKYDHGSNDFPDLIRKYPLIRDPETVQWWNDQSAKAQSAFSNPTEMKRALSQFADWYVEYDNGNYGSQKIRLWANDPHFDVSILQAAFDAVGLDEPWHYRSPRSMKTMLDISGITREEMEQFNHGTTHNALDDAISQAKIVCETYRRLGLQK